MTVLDCVKESVGGRVRIVGKAIGDLLVNHWYLKGLGKCWTCYESTSCEWSEPFLAAKGTTVSDEI